jgi:ATP-binding cassette, subfamily B, bacterial
VIRRIRALRRVLVIVFGTGFRVAPKKMTMAVTTTLAVAALSVGYTVGFRIVVNAIVAHDTARALVGVAVVAGLFAGQWGLAVYVTLLNNTVRDLCDLFLSARIAQMVNAIPGIEHFERRGVLT